ncbi:MAG: hypothetical protein J1F24_00395 [Oscillospiraceae bacterium]|nr:hypothetical protein [Oscillospiraceae bacterium]
MAKKVLTPEEYKAKIDKKAEKRKRFGKTFLTTFAFALACVVVFASMAIAFTPNTGVAVSGGNNGGNVVSSGSDNVSSGDNNNGGSNVADVPGDDNNGGSDAADVPGDGNNAGDNNDNNANDGKGDAATEDKVDSTQQAIDLYKTAMAKVKSSAKTVTHTKGGATNYKGIVEAGKLSSAASSLMGMFMKEEEPNEVIDKADLPPKGGATKLTKATVKSATIKEEGNYQVVTIVMNDAVNPASGADGIGAVANVIEESQITGSISSVPGLKLSNIKVAYENVNVTCKIEKSTGNMVYLLVDAPCILSLDAKLAVVTVNNAQVGIECKDEYTIAF